MSRQKTRSKVRYPKSGHLDVVQVLIKHFTYCIKILMPTLMKHLAIYGKEQRVSSQNCLWIFKLCYPLHIHLYNILVYFTKKTLSFFVKLMYYFCKVIIYLLPTLGLLVSVKLPSAAWRVWSPNVTRILSYLACNRDIRLELSTYSRNFCKIQ